MSMNWLGLCFLGTVLLERFHTQYRELHAELLARPFPVVSGQVMVAYRAVLFTPAEKAGHCAAVAALAAYPGVVASPVEHGFQILRWGTIDLRIEWHTEFTAFTVLAPQAGIPFADLPSINCRRASSMSFPAESWPQSKSPPNRCRLMMLGRRRRWNEFQSYLPVTGSSAAGSWSGSPPSGATSSLMSAAQPGFWSKAIVLLPGAMAGFAAAGRNRNLSSGGPVESAPGAGITSAGGSDRGTASRVDGAYRDHECWR